VAQGNTWKDNNNDWAVQKMQEKRGTEMCLSWQKGKKCAPEKLGDRTRAFFHTCPTLVLL